MTFLPAWAVDGSKVPASMARRETYSRSGGKGGIARATDLAVRELPTPGGAVRIMPGAATLINDYPGGGGQAYSVANDAAYDGLTVPATGSGDGATRYVIVRVDDPEFGGQVPANPLTASYCSVELVPSVDSLPYPHEVLARIDQPSNTATITQNMITDMRRISNPRTWSELRVYPLTGSEGDTISSTRQKGEVFPNHSWDIYIPEWATNMTLRGEWISIAYPSGNTYGQIWFEWGPYVEASKREFSTQRNNFNSDTGSDVRKDTLVAADNQSIPARVRGTTQKFMPKARKTGGAGTNATITASGALVLQIEFRELPASDYTP